MTLMDAPRYDAAGSRRRIQMLYVFFSGVIVLLIVGWLVAGRPVDWPWTWYAYWSGDRVTDQFLRAVESKDLPRAYGIWVHDPEWQQHAANYKTYPFERFKEDWSPDSSDNDYGAISSHQIVVSKARHTDLIVGSMINGRKSKPLFLAYSPSEHTLSFSPVELTIPR